MLCPNCNKTIHENANYCPYCRTKIVKNNTFNKESEQESIDYLMIIAMILNLIIPGLGHLVMKLYWKGIIIFMLNYILMYLSGLYPGVYGINFDIHNIILIAYRILIIIDVYYSYKDIKSNKKYPGLI